MARGTGKLSARAVAAAAEPGWYDDGGGLRLQVTKSGAKSWVYRFMLAGKSREMGLGALADVSLAEARNAATEARKLVKAGTDPIAQRESQREAARASEALALARAMTFRQCAEAYIEAHKAGWGNEKHRLQWPSTMRDYVFPVFGALSVQDIDLPMVMKAVEPIWTAKTSTASKVRGRIEAVLDWATVRGFRKGDNPARWRGQLAHLLPAPSKVRKVKHHAALPYAEMNAFMVELRKRDGISPRAFEFAVLTAARRGEVLGATWGEIDMEARTWIIPAERMKASRDHRVPLSEPALAILRTMDEHRLGDVVFPGSSGRPLSKMSLERLLARMGRTDMTTHGCRSSFRDWCAERTGYPNEMAEMALAHAVGNQVEAAYRRGDLFEKRRRMMDDWATFCNTMPAESGATVVPMRKAI